MVIAFWLVVLVVSLIILVRGADIFLENAERIGLFFKLPSFTIGVILVGIGTSLPELATAIVAVLERSTEIVAANAIGSNISNILLIGGVLAFYGRNVWISRDLLDSELPFFVISTALFLGIVFDGEVSRIESLMLFSTFIVYLYYLFSGESEDASDVVIAERQRHIRRERKLLKFLPEGSVLVFLLLGLSGVIVGAKFLIDAVLALATMLSIAPDTITMTAIALGTSLPELSVSIRALQHNKLEVALGNIFGSNAFNILMAVGVPGLFTALVLGEETLMIGVPILAVASFILLVIGLARKMYRWEGIMFLILYVFFVLKLAGV